MAAESLVEVKLETSKRLSKELIERGSPLLASYWDFSEDVDRWTLVLVPIVPDEERRLIREAIALLIQEPYRSVFSVTDAVIDSRRIDRAQALGDYIRVEPYAGKRIDLTFTGGQYFESVIPVYLAPQLMTHLSPA